MRITHPRYKFFPETGEEKYHSFLGVPIVERGTPIGVLVVQTLRRRQFSRARDPPAARHRDAGGQHHRAGAPARGPEEQGEGAPRVPPPDDHARSSACRRTRRRATEQPEARARGAARARLNGLPAAPGFGRGTGASPPAAGQLRARSRDTTPTTSTERAAPLPPRRRRSPRVEIERLKERLARAPARVRPRRSSTRTA